MGEKSTGKRHKSDFTELIPEYEDQEILEILKKRKFYQPGAVSLAVQEAIKRGLIHSEQDLVAEEFNNLKKIRYSLFPSIDKEHQKNKIRKSISRGLIVLGILPFVWGLFRFNDGSELEGSILVVGGILWIFLSLRIYRRIEIAIIRLMFVLLLVSMIYIIKVFSGLGSIVFMDAFISVVVYGLIVYGLLFMLKINRL